MKAQVITLLFSTSLLWCGDPSTSWSQVPEAVESPSISAITRITGPRRDSAVAAFWRRVAPDHAPLLDSIPGDPLHVRMTFVWRGDSSVSDVVLVANPDGLTPFRDLRTHLVRIPQTDIWYRTYTLPITAEFSYLFSIDPADATSGPDTLKTLRVDPINPLQYRILTGPLRSIARAPGVERNPWIVNHHVPAGNLVEDSITSRILTTGALRRLWVYRTPGKLGDANLLILLDGATYARSIPTARILDNLFAEHLIGPTIAIFVADGEHWQKDLYFDDDFVSFLADELVPWVQREYGVTASAPRTVIGGESIAGLTAAYAAFRRPAVFTKVLTQSASFWLNNRGADDGEPEWLARQILSAPTSGLSFWIDVGQMEFVPNEADRMFPPFVPGTTSLLAANRHLRDLLRAKCYSVVYSETYGAHEPLRWARTLPQGLIALLGAEGVSSNMRSENSYLNPSCSARPGN